MSMVNPGGLVQFAAPAAAMKDSRWLTLEVCREFQRNKCTRSDLECKFAHPPPHVEVQNGRVVCCYDSIKGKCQRKEPPCKYLHPPQHLREQLVQNGRNNLIIKNIQMQMLSHNLAVNSQFIPISGHPQHLLNGSNLTGAPPSQAHSYQPASYLSTTGPLQIMPPADHHHQQQQLAQVSMSMASNGASASTGQIKIDAREFGAKRPTVADSKSGIPVYQPASFHHHQQHLAAAAAAAAAATMGSPYQLPSGPNGTAGAFLATAWNPSAEVLCASQVAWP